jgi:DNA primase
VRHASGWTDFQVKKHMQRLEEMEYVLVHSGGRGKSIAYELLYQGEGQAGEAFMMGLIDPGKLKSYRYDAQKEPPKVEKEPPSSPQSAPKKPSSSSEKKAAKPDMAGPNGQSDKNPHKRTIGKNNGASHHTSALAAEGVAL